MGKFYIFCQLVTNFVAIRQNNSVFMKKKNVECLKISTVRKVHILTIISEFRRFSAE